MSPSRIDHDVYETCQSTLDVDGYGGAVDVDWLLDADGYDGDVDWLLDPLKGHPIHRTVRMLVGDEQRDTWAQRTWENFLLPDIWDSSLTNELKDLVSVKWRDKGGIALFWPSWIWKRIRWLNEFRIAEG
jgi:hypothetical protein